ncbi:MAG: OB-fold nucleic acid binding domain-containing protein, partial [Sphingobacteriales bacterium]
MFNNRIKIKELLQQEPIGADVIVMGWVRTFRNNQFIALNDGSTNANVQVVAELGKFDESLLRRLTTSAAIRVRGRVAASVGKGQRLE